MAKHQQSASGLTRLSNFARFGKASTTCFHFANYHVFLAATYPSSKGWPFCSFQQGDASQLGFSLILPGSASPDRWLSFAPTLGIAGISTGLSGTAGLQLNRNASDLLCYCMPRPAEPTRPRLHSSSLPIDPGHHSSSRSPSSTRSGQPGHAPLPLTNHCIKPTSSHPLRQPAKVVCSKACRPAAAPTLTPPQPLHRMVSRHCSLRCIKYPLSGCAWYL